MRKFIIIKAISLLLFITVALPVYSQSGTVAAGGDVENNSHRISYSIGQPFAEVGSISEGVQQPYKLTVIGLNESKRYSVKVFPNPVVDALNIRVSDNQSKQFIFYSYSGKILAEDVFIKSSSLKVKDFSKGIYFLKILHTQNNIETFKIIIQ